jgi:hypothetical protein
MDKKDNIRNMSVIAHVDHGKACGSGWAGRSWHSEGAANLIAVSLPCRQVHAYGLPGGCCRYYVRGAGGQASDAGLQA